MPDPPPFKLDAGASNPLVALSCFLVAGVSGAWLLRRLAPATYARLIRALAPRDAADTPTSRWTFIGAAVLGVALAFLEWRQPFYFVDDDALVGELPSVLVGFRALWSGHFPSMDPYIFLGAPLASLGLSSFTYPPSYLGYAIARHVIGRDEAVFDVLAVMHLVGGYFVLERVARMRGAGRLTAPAAALSFALSGSLLMLGRSWHMMAAAGLWIPVLALCVTHLGRGPVGWRWALATGTCIGVWFHVGFSQVWLYGVGLSTIAAAIQLGAAESPRRNLAWGLVSLLVGAAIAAPLLVPQAIDAAGVLPRTNPSYGVGHALAAFLFPWPLVVANHPEGWGNNHPEWMGTLEYFGTTFAVVPALMLFVLATRRPVRGSLAANAWLVAGILAFVLALGPFGGLWTLLSRLPVLKAINHDPFRLLPFAAAYLSLAGAPFLERLIAESRSPRGWNCGIAGCTVGLVLWNASHVQANYSYAFRPYPKLSPAIASRVIEPREPRRFLPVTTFRSPAPWFAETLPFNLPATHAAFSFDGYDPIVESSSPWALIALSMRYDPVATGRAYGVRYFLVDRSMADPVLSNGLFCIYNELHRPWPLMERLLAPPFVKVAEDDHVDVYELPDSAPMAFRVAEPTLALPFEANPGGIRLQTPPSGGEVVVSFLARPLVVARLDGRIAPLRADPWSRVRVLAPPGGAALEIRYEAPWGLGLAIGAALGALAGVLGRSLRVAERARTPPG